MTAPRSRAKALSAFVPGIIGETLAARGMGEASLIADWPAIVGETIAAYARPIELQWPAHSPKRDPAAPAPVATLVLRIDGAFALEAQHNASILMARVNAHLGWRCVGKVVFRQGPLPPRPRRRSRAPAPSPEAEARAQEAAGAIADEALRAAVTRLGALTIDRADRLEAAARAGRRGA
jgi:hypothetical protein